MNDVYEGMNMKVITNDCKGHWYNEGEIFKVEKYGESYPNSQRIYYFKNRSDGVEINNSKILLDKVFLSKFKDEKIAVNCETEEEARELMVWLKDHNITWTDGDNIDLSDISYYTENTCYHFNWDESFTDLCFSKVKFMDGYTIIKYKDLIKEEEGVMDYMKEFIRYWGENKVGVRFKNLEDKQSFCYKINSGSTGSNRDNIVACCTDATGGCWFNRKEDDTIWNDYKIINYKDIKNWESILLEESKSNPYKILKPFTLKDIMDAKPCNSDGELWDLCNEFKERGLDYNYKVASWTDFKSFRVMMDYKDWMEEKGFIEKVKEEIVLKVGMKFKHLDGDLWKVISVDGELHFLHLKSSKTYGEVDKYKGWIHAYELIEE